MPETAAGRALLVALTENFWATGTMRGDESAIDAIEAEARALGRAEALAAAGHAVLALAGFHPGEDGDLVLRSSVLAAIDNLETP